MDKITLIEISNKKFILNIIQENDGNILSNTLSMDKSELRELYVKLREMFTTNVKKTIE